MTAVCCCSFFSFLVSFPTSPLLPLKVVTPPSRVSPGLSSLQTLHTQPRQFYPFLCLQISSVIPVCPRAQLQPGLLYTLDNSWCSRRQFRHSRCEPHQRWASMTAQAESCNSCREFLKLILHRASIPLI